MLAILLVLIVAGNPLGPIAVETMIIQCGCVWSNTFVTIVYYTWDYKLNFQAGVFYIFLVGGTMAIQHGCVVSLLLSRQGNKHMRILKV